MPFGDYLRQGAGQKFGKWGGYLADDEQRPLGQSAVGGAQAQKDEPTSHAPNAPPAYRDMQPRAPGGAKGPAPSQFQVDPHPGLKPGAGVDLKAGMGAGTGQGSLPPPPPADQYDAAVLQPGGGPVQNVDVGGDPNQNGIDTGYSSFGEYMQAQSKAMADPYFKDELEQFDEAPPGWDALDKAEQAGVAQLEADQAKSMQALDEQAQMAGIGASGAYAQGLEGLTTQGSLATASFKADIAEKKAQQQLSWLDTKLKTLSDIFKTTTDAGTKLAIQEEIAQLEQQKIDIQQQAEKFQESSEFGDISEAMLSTFIADANLSGSEADAFQQAYHSASGKIWEKLASGDLTYDEAKAILNEVLGVFSGGSGEGDDSLFSGDALAVLLKKYPWLPDSGGGLGPFVPPVEEG